MDLQDLRVALRSLMRTPIFAVTAAAILALGIGANATVFTIVNTVMLRPLPFTRSNDIVEIRRRVPSGSSISFDMHDYLALRAQRGALSALSILDVFPAGRFNLIVDGTGEPVTAVRVSAEFFSVFGVTPVRGRLFAEGDDTPGRPGIAVVSEGFWKRRFATDPGLVGRPLNIGGQPRTIVGIAPDAMRAFSPADVFLILPVPAGSTDRTNSFRVLARVAPGIDRARAEAQIDAIARRHAAQSASLTNMPQGIVLRPLQDDLVSPIRPALVVLTFAVALVLLVACSNVSNLVLARGVARRREFAVMAALGASRWRIIRRVCAENLIVACIGGAGGLLLARAGVQALAALPSVNVPQVDRIHVDAWVLLFVGAAVVLAAVAAGLPPALQLSRSDIAAWLKEGSAQSGSGTRTHRLRTMLTLSQVALSTVLLVGAGLLVRSFWNLTSVDPGFRTDDVLTMNVSMTPSRYGDSVRVGAYSRAVSGRLEQIPGVVAASSTTALPAELPIDFPVRRVGDARDAANLDAWFRAVDPHFFTALDVPVLAGRTFDDGDSASGPPVAIVSQALARAAFPAGDAIGQAIVIGEGYLTDARDLRPRTIVGIAGDTREQGLRFAPTMTMYVPVPQSPELITKLVVEKIPLRWIIRTKGDAAEVVPAVRRAVLSVDPTQPPADFASMDAVLRRSIAPNRFSMMMMTLFGSLALTLAAIGVYGLVAYNVAQRSREIGIRVSLGASRHQLVGGLVWQSLRLCLVGTAIGAAGSLFLGRLFRTLLFGIGPTDPLTIVVIVSTMLAVVTAATYLPASRAASVDPILVLRRE